MKHFQKYILFILLAALPTQFLGTEQSKETLLKKFKEKSLAAGKIGLGVGGISFAVLLMAGEACGDYKPRQHCCCCDGYHCSKLIEIENNFNFEQRLFVSALNMIKENYKKLKGAQGSVELQKEKK